MKNILPLILAVLVLVAALAGYWYLLSAVRSAMDVGATARAEGSAAEEREKFARTAETFLAGLSAEQTELETLVARDEDFVSVIEMVEATALREGVKATIGSVSVEKQGAQFHETVSVSASARGSFKNVASFISALETLPFASRVVAVNLETSTDESWFGTVTIEIVKRKP